MANKVKAFGIFGRRGEHIYRSSAYLQFGESEDTIGIVVMLNPGAARLVKADDEKRLDTEECSNIFGEVVIDPTMQQLIELVEEMHAERKIARESITGRVHIYNLFPIRQTDSTQAIKEFNKLWDQNDPLVRNSIVTEELKKQLKEAQWFLRGWGCACHTNS